VHSAWQRKIKKQWFWGAGLAWLDNFILSSAVPAGNDLTARGPVIKIAPFWK